MMIINSDDFGYSPKVNRATYKAFKKKIISSTTALVNFKTGFDDAISYIHSGKLNRNAIGIHLNISEGPPLTKKIKQNKRFCKKGVFYKRTKSPIFYLNAYDRECVLEEMQAQLNLFIVKFGFLPNHIDTHHHIHVEWGFTKIVMKLAKKHDIARIRLAQNTGSMAAPKWVYRAAINKHLKWSGFKTMDKFGGIEEILYSGIDPHKSYEIMVHALLSSNGKDILDLDGEELTSKLTKLLGQKPWNLSNYNQL